MKIQSETDFENKFNFIENHQFQNKWNNEYVVKMFLIVVLLIVHLLHYIA
jgi:hypothetical protein